jgi:hypothetical protein
MRVRAGKTKNIFPPVHTSITFLLLVFSVTHFRIRIFRWFHSATELIPVAIASVLCISLFEIMDDVFV